jgi:hypothetical protein
MLYVRLPTWFIPALARGVDLQRHAHGHYLDPNRKPREMDYTDVLVGDSDHWT